jgi:hypothetical protein
MLSPPGTRLLARTKFLHGAGGSPSSRFLCSADRPAVAEQWSLNPQYSYGWTVPFLVGWLVYWRRPRRRAFSRATSRPNDYVRSWRRCLLPAVNRRRGPDWRLLSWVMALLVALIFFSVNSPAPPEAFQLSILFFCRC